MRGAAGDVETLSTSVCTAEDGENVDMTMYVLITLTVGNVDA